MKTAVVITAAEGRMKNLIEVAKSLFEQTFPPALMVVVCDGWEMRPSMTWPLPTMVIDMPKHKPGEEQPRNKAVRMIREMGEKEDARLMHGITHIWFLDSDVVVSEFAHQEYQTALQLVRKTEAGPWRCPECGHTEFVETDSAECPSCEFAGYEDEDGWIRVDPVMVGPYEALEPNKRKPNLQLHNDPRWPWFNNKPYVPHLEDLGAGLAMFAGNMVWPLDEFDRVKGFWDEIHHGRWEYVELGLRAVRMRTPILPVPDARGWHLHHKLAGGDGLKDGPLIADRHPWALADAYPALHLDAEGRLNVRCECRWTGDIRAYWQHRDEDCEFA